ncbi:MAG: hypothetical protein OHK0046_35400 [Anaerolineae bacterium]
MPTLRPCTTSDTDTRAFAECVETAADGLFAVFFGSGWPGVLQRAAAIPQHTLSYETATFVEVDGQIAGMISAYSGAWKQQVNASQNSALVRAAGWRIVRAAFYATLLSRLMTFFGDIPTDMYYVQTVAIYPQFRGQNLSQHLLEHAEQSGQAAGCAQIGLHVLTTNTPAIGAYRKFGMDVIKTSDDVHLGGRDYSLHLMAKPLPRAGETNGD